MLSVYTEQTFASFSKASQDCQLRLDYTDANGSEFIRKILRTFAGPSTHEFAPSSE